LNPGSFYLEPGALATELFRFLYVSGPLQTDTYKLGHKESLTNVPFSHYYAFFDKTADQIVSVSLNQNGVKYHPIITGDGSPNSMYWNDFAEIYDEVGEVGEVGAMIFLSIVFTQYLVILSTQNAKL